VQLCIIRQSLPGSAANNKGWKRIDPRNLSQPFLPGSVVGECSMERAVTFRKLRKYRFGNCTLVTNLAEGNHRD
jgi:hypothetical protein